MVQVVEYFWSIIILYIYDDAGVSTKLITPIYMLFPPPYHYFSISRSCKVARLLGVEMRRQAQAPLHMSPHAWQETRQIQHRAAAHGGRFFIRGRAWPKENK